MQACAIKFWTLLLLAIAGITVQAQEISPYSRFGVGDIESPDFAASQSLGGLSSAFRDPINLNLVNPASYTHLAYVTFNLGVQANTKWMSTDSSSYSTGDAFLDNVAMAFPFLVKKRRMAIAIALKPYSSMRYDMQGTYTDTLGNSFSRLYSGAGRTYDLTAGYAVNVFHKLDSSGRNELKSLSLGVNAAYRFGQLRYGEVLTINDGSSLSARRNTTLRMSDVVVTVGAQYKTCLNCPITATDTSNLKKKIEQDSTGKKFDDWRATYMTVGFYGGIPSNLNSSYSSVFDRFYVAGSNVVTIDTVSSSGESKIKLNMPVQFGGGITFGDNIKWLVGLDVKYTMWDGFNSLNQGSGFRNSLRIGGGLQLTPDVEGKGFIRRTQYRVGGYYDSGYLDINGNTISEFGMTFGLGLPMRPLGKGFDMLNIGLQAGSRGTTSNGLLQESFVRVSIGFLLNSAGYDSWFRKTKYD